MRKFMLSLLGVAATLVVSHAQVSQDFESNDRGLIRNDCWIIWGFSPSGYDVISGNYSARSQQLTNASDSAQLVSPYTLFDGSGNITFSHKLSANNGTERVLYVALFDQNGDFVQNLETYTYRTGNVAQTGNATLEVNGSIAVNFSGVYRIGFYATGSGGNSRVLLDDVMLPGTNSADASQSDGYGDCAAIVAPSVDQDFESGDRTAIRNNCWIIWGFNPKTNDAINGTYSARSQQLTNANDSAQLVSPYTLFDGTGNITFSHKLDGNNGSERVLYVALFDQNGDFVQTLETYTYRSGNVNQNGNPTLTVNGSIAVNFSGVYRIGFFANGSGGNSRVILDDVSIPGQNAADAGNSDGYGDCAPIVAPSVDQDFESNDRTAIRNNCWIIWGFSTSGNNAIGGSYSARSQQLTNANDSAQLVSPYTLFDGTGNITFSHKLDGNNGSERVLYVALFDQNGDFVQNLETYTYRTGNVPQTGDATIAVNGSIAVNFSGVYRIGFFANGSGGNSRVILDDVSIPGQNAADAGNSDGYGDCAPILPQVPSAYLVSDASWSLSNVVTTATANSYPWPGVSTVPAPATFTEPVTVGQPYPWNHVFTVDSSEVITALSGVTYYRKTFDLTDNTNLDVRFRMFVDDNMQIFVNGQWIALEDGMGPNNFKTANHDLLIEANGNIVNGNNGGDQFDYVTNVDLSTVFVIGENEIVLAIRNRTSKPDRGGFSFRMDIEQNGQPVIVNKAAEAGAPAPEAISGLDFEAYPNPTSGLVNVSPVHTTKVQEFTISVIDLNGRVLQQVGKNYANQGESTVIDLSAYPGGVYSLKIENGNEVFVKQVILQ